MNAIKRELNARLMKEREEQIPIKSGLTANQWTAIVLVGFTIIAIVLTQLGLIA